MTDLHPCVKCIAADMKDGWGRCTMCREPEATPAEIAAEQKRMTWPWARAAT